MSTTLLEPISITEVNDVAGKPKKSSERKTDRPKPNRTKVPLHVEITPALRNAIDEAVRRERRALNVVVAIALEQYLTSLNLWPPVEPSEN